MKAARATSQGPGITEVVLDTDEGPITISRKDGRLATFTSPDQPDRPVALKRRDVPELLAEELRRLDEDDVYAATAKKLVASGIAPTGGPQGCEEVGTEADQEAGEEVTGEVVRHDDAGAVAADVATRLLEELARCRPRAANHRSG